MNMLLTYSHKVRFSPSYFPAEMKLLSHKPSILYHYSPLSTTYEPILNHLWQKNKCKYQIFFDSIQKKALWSQAKELFLPHIIHFQSLYLQDQSVHPAAEPQIPG